MSVAWTTILIIALLFPGVFFFIGYSSRERFSREIVRSNAIGEVGLAVLIALIIHLSAWGVLSLFGFDLAAFARPLSNIEKLLPAIATDLIVQRILPVALYVIGTALMGLLCGCAVAWLIFTGRLPFLVRHKWINVVNAAMREGLVTAYVMTATVQNGRALMYKGVLAEFYLTVDGSLTYVVLKSCSRFLMMMDGNEPTTTKQLQLFGPGQADRDKQFWDYLFIDAKNIANILFDPSPEIKNKEGGSKALDEALAEFQKLIEARKAKVARDAGF